ncbi:GFA family protein [Shimia aestuarii]|nr:GFA family protein [Shimia aestuarii]
MTQKTFSERITGQCKCGGVRYEGTRADAPAFRCYCRDCQQLTGTGHSEMVPLVRDTFSVTGDMREFEMQGGSGGATWSGFCPDCGSPILRRSARMSDRLYVHAGSLDRPEEYRPEKVIYPDAAQPWDQPD